ncbi:MAG TPA: hypothetical protein VIE42_01665 [Steroidobacteraceae bacterium]|jgi:hypothetical protein
MKKTLLLCSLLALPAGAAVAGDFRTGTYEATGTHITVSFDDKGQFHVNKGETLEVTGTYSVKTSELQLTDSLGPWACSKAGEQTGTYAWKYENAALTFSKVADKCEDRVNSLVKRAWKRQKQAAAGAASTADSPWTGTWRLDAARSHFTGQTFTYSKSPGQLLHYDDGSTASFDFGIDGKEYKAYSNRTISWTAAGTNAWDTVVKAEGKVRSSGHIELSADGKTLNMVFTGTKPDGNPFREEDTFTRVSGSDGLIGTWRTAKVVGPSGPQTFVVAAPAPGVLHIEVPDMKAHWEGRTDGSDHPLMGGPPGTTVANQRLSPTRFTYVFKMNGKTDNMGEWNMAADGGSFTDMNWVPGRENEKTTAVYVKQ